MSDTKLPDAIQQALNDGTPLYTVEICPPMKVFVQQEGVLEIDCTSTSIGYGNQAGVVRLRLSKEAVTGLRKSLAALGTILDEQASGIESRSTH